MKRFRSRTRVWAIRSVFVLALATGVALLLISGASGTLSNSTFNAGDGNMTIDPGDTHDWADAATYFGSNYTGNIPDLFNSTSDNAFTSGQKQDTACPDISGQKSPPKDDFTSAAYASEQYPASTGDLFLYGATFRYAGNGNASENIELNQGTAGKCTGSSLYKRVKGDRLLTIDYLNGGTSASFHILTWIVDGSDPNNSTCFVSNDIPPCWGVNALQLDPSEAEGAVNQVALTPAQNPITNVAVGQFQFAEFGVDLTKAIGLSGCGKIAQTEIEARASGASFVSTTKDIVIGTKPLNPCQPTLTTDAGGPYLLGSNGTVALSDKATLSGGTSSATGKLTYSLYSDSSCTKLVTNGTVTETDVAGANGVQYTSPPVTVSAPGIYHWRVKFDSTDPANNSVGLTACGATGENPVVLNPKTTLHVTDTLTGLTAGATGTVNYTAYLNLTDCQSKPPAAVNGTSVFDLTPTPNTVSGNDAPTSNSIDVPPGTTVYFTATYSGNEGTLTTSCTAEKASSG
jgi:hypothetical protein